MEPVKVTAPMKIPMPTSPRWKPISAATPGSRLPDSSMKVLKPTSTAARPTKECSSAISSGIPVISTVLALYRPITAPTSKHTAISRAFTHTGYSECADCPASATKITATSAMVMPAIPNLFPRRAVVCFDNPASAMMNSSAATRYARYSTCAER